MNGRLQNKVAVITGGASGIGRATAELFAREGARLLIADLNRENGEKFCAELQRAGHAAIFECADVSRAEDCRRIIERVRSQFGALHVLFNNAGIIRRATVVDLEEADWDRIMNVNAKSVFLLSKFAIPLMLGSGGGAIINTASGWGLSGGERAAAYCASKGAVVLLTKAMAVDHGPQGIRVNCICPGDTDTSMLDAEARQLNVSKEKVIAASSSRPLRRVGKPEEIAQAVLYLATDASSFVTGTALVIDGGALAGST
jgi:NAD(P)-dependent dehydrogenase (short-subunit alcohol dehydrogenase family)